MDRNTTIVVLVVLGGLFFIFLSGWHLKILAWLSGKNPAISV